MLPPSACVGFLRCNRLTHSHKVLSKWSQVRGVLDGVCLPTGELCTTGWLLAVAKFGMLVMACISEKIPGSILW